MDAAIRAQMANLRSTDRAVQGDAYDALMAATEGPVDWADEVWDDLLLALKDRGNRLRSIAAQLLCNLAKSDTRGRMLGDFEALMAVTRDDRFVTARHCLRALWMVGAAGPRQRQMVVDRLADRYAEAADEKNGTLIRFDILQGLRQLYDMGPDEPLKRRALALIDREADPKYRKKYAAVWRGV